MRTPAAASVTRGRCADELADPSWSRNSKLYGPLKGEVQLSVLGPYERGSGPVVCDNFRGGAFGTRHARRTIAAAHLNAKPFAAPSP
jgi:hypothetical protein